MSKKVYELAKELELSSIELVEKIRGMGINVRNHMVKLSDEDLSTIMNSLNAAKEEEKAKTAKKKKVVKKRTKKKTTKKASSDGDEEVKKVVKKRTVRKRKGGVVEEEKPPVAAAESTQPEVTSFEDNMESPKTVERIDDSPRGLKVVQGAPVQESKTAAETPASAEAPKKEIYKEKLHKFTPVYVPKPGEVKKKETKAPRTFNNAPATPGTKGKSSKRIGDLAAIVSKRGGEKSKDIHQIRAEEGVKLASNVVGNTVYIPARKKKVFIGETKNTIITEVKDSKRVVRIHDVITAADLAAKLSQKFKNFSGKCLDINLLVEQEDYIGIKLATSIAALYDYRVENVAFDEEAALGKTKEKSNSDHPLRNPIITIMGHVDHGKTTLLDTIRKEKVADGEAGGITQHIGAYSVKVKDSTLTFLDTPGHAAFASMRQRGADVTDIVVLVVAADDGVMPQTKESIKFIQKSKKPLIVAVNKMDKEGANPDKIKQALMEFSITPEEWGGDTQFVNISALKGDGIDSLLEAIQLQAEVMELRANPKGKAEGIIIESKIETGRGPVCTVLVESGTLKKGDAVVVGEFAGRARSLIDHTGKMIPSAGPSMPVQIFGLDGTPSPGDTLNVVKNEREAKKIVENRATERKEIDAASKKKMSLEDFFGAASGTDEKKVMKLIVRSDVLGSYEAIKNSLEALGNDEVGVEVVGGGAGAITDSDVNFAESIEGYIIGFNMRPVTSARKLSEQKGIDVKTYSIIYELLDDVKLALEGMLDPERIEVYIGRAQVKETFNIPKIGKIAGSEVIDGKIAKGCHIRLLREEKIIFDGKLSTLKRFKDEVKEVKNGLECGIALEGCEDVLVGDLFEAYMLEEKKRSLETRV